MSAEGNKAIIRRLVDEFWNKGNEGVFDEIFAPSFHDHTPPPGADGSKESFRQVTRGMMAAFSDGHTAAEPVIAEGDKVTWRWTFRGRHTGPLMGVPATGKEVTIVGITIDRFAGGQIVERWQQVDNLGMLQQLGVIPTPG